MGKIPIESAGSTLIQNLRLSLADLNAIKRLSAAHTATSSRSIQAIGLAPGFNSLMKNSLKVCMQSFKSLCNREIRTKSKCANKVKILQETSRGFICMQQYNEIQFVIKVLTYLEMFQRVFDFCQIDLILQHNS